MESRTLWASIVVNSLTAPKTQTRFGLCVAFVRLNPDGDTQTITYQCFRCNKII